MDFTPNTKKQNPDFPRIQDFPLGEVGQVLIEAKTAEAMRKLAGQIVPKVMGTSDAETLQEYIYLAMCEAYALGSGMLDLPKK